MRRLVVLGIALGLALSLAACRPAAVICKHTGMDCAHGEECTPSLGVGCGPDGHYRR